MTKRVGSGCGTTGALLELCADIYNARIRSSDCSGTLFESGHHNSPHNNFAKGGGGGRTRATTATGTEDGDNNEHNQQRRVTTALQSRLAEAITKTSDKDLILASRRWLVAVFRAFCVGIDDHPQTPLRRAFVGGIHDFFDLRLLSAPPELILDPSASPVSGSVPRGPVPGGSVSQTSAAAAAASSGQSPAASSLSTSPPQSSSSSANNNKTTQPPSSSSSSSSPPAAAASSGNSAGDGKNISTASPSPTRGALGGSNGGGGGTTIPVSSPVNPAEILRRFLLRPSEVASCQWYEGSGKLRALLERPVENLYRELNHRVVAAQSCCALLPNNNNNNQNNNSQRQQQQQQSNNNMEEEILNQKQASMFGDFEGIVLQYVQDEEGIWSRSTPVINLDAPEQQRLPSGENHGIGLENVTPSWHAENRFTASQFSEPNSLMVSRTSSQVVVAVPWGERERIYAMLFFPPHVDDRYARLVAWDLYTAARVAFGEDTLAAPKKKAIKKLLDRSRKMDFDNIAPSREIVEVLGKMRSKTILESAQHVLALRRRYSPCPVFPVVLNSLSPARNDVAVERVVLELCAYVYRAIGASDFAIFHDHRVLYTNVSLAVTGVMQNAFHMVRNQALEAGEFLADLPGWTGSNDLDHVNDCTTLVAPVSWPPGGCLTQLCVEGTPQKAESPHRLCAVWTVGHNNFSSSSLEIVFILPPPPASTTSNSNSPPSFVGGGLSQTSFTTSSSSPVPSAATAAASGSSPSPSPSSGKNNNNNNNEQQQQAPPPPPVVGQAASAFAELAWSKTEPILLWEVHDSLYPVFVLSERLNDAILFCQKRASSSYVVSNLTGVANSVGTGGFDSNNYGAGGVVGQGTGIGPGGGAGGVGGNSFAGAGNISNQPQSVTLTGDGTAASTNRSVTYELHKLGFAQTFSNMKNNSHYNYVQPNHVDPSSSSPLSGSGSGMVGSNSYSGSPPGPNANNLGGISQPNFAGANNAPPPPAPAGSQSLPNFSLNDYVDPDCHELDRLTRLSASFVYSSLKPTKDLWCAGGSSYSGLFGAKQDSSSSGAGGVNAKDTCVRLRPAQVPGVVLTTVAQADSSQFTLAESRHSYAFALQ